MNTLTASGQQREVVKGQQKITTNQVILVGLYGLWNYGILASKSLSF